MSNELKENVGTQPWLHENAPVPNVFKFDELRIREQVEGVATRCEIRVVVASGDEHGHSELVRNAGEIDLA